MPSETPDFRRETRDGFDLLDLDAAAAALGVSKSTMEGWVRSKAISSFKHGRVRRVAREELARFVLANTIRCRRPDWLCGAVQGEFEKKIAEIAAREFGRVLARLETLERFLATQQRPAIAA